MPTASSTTGFLAGLFSITAKDLGKKVGLSILADFFTAPSSFFLNKGLAALFGGEDQFKEVFEKLEQLEHEIEGAVGKISAVVQESELEEEHTHINTYFSNLKTAATNSSNITTGYKDAYDSFFSPNTVEILDQINQDSEQIRDRLLGHAPVSQGYLDLVATRLYGSNSDIYAFDSRLTALSALYIQDLIHATLVLSCILNEASDPLHKKKAEELIVAIGGYKTEITNFIRTVLRDVPTVVEGVDTIRFMLRNKETDKLLGRYVDTLHHSQSIICHFEMHSKGEGYFYLKVPGKDVGIDHYYGKDIRPVHKGDSTHPNHLWKFDPSPSEPNRYYRIVNKATGAALDDYYGRSIKGAPNDEHPNHLWEILPDKDGNTCRMVNKATGHLLGYDASHRKFDSFSGGYTVDVGTYNPSFPLPNSWTNGIWKLVRHDSEKFHNLVNSHSGDALDYYDGESFRFVGSPSGHPNHLWCFEPTKVDGTVDGQKKAYNFIRNKATNQVLDHYYGKCVKGAGDTKAEAPHANHIWRIDIL